MTLILSPLKQALASLQRGLFKARTDLEDEELRDACIQRFEYTFELSWKSLKRYLAEEDPTQVEHYSKKELFRVAYERGVIRDADAWFTYLNKRNQTVHTYDAQCAKEVFDVIPNFVEDVQFLVTQLKNMND